MKTYVHISSICSISPHCENKISILTVGSDLTLVLLVQVSIDKRHEKVKTHNKAQHKHISNGNGESGVVFGALFPHFTFLSEVSDCSGYKHNSNKHRTKQANKCVESGLASHPLSSLGRLKSQTACWRVLSILFCTNTNKMLLQSQGSLIFCRVVKTAGQPFSSSIRTNICLGLFFYYSIHIVSFMY